MAVDVVIVDDDPMFRHLISECIRSLGWRPHCLSGVEAGLRKILELRPALVITDIHLPDGDGFALCRRVKEEPALRGCRVIMVTGTYHKGEDKLRGAELGADAYLLKPFHIPELLRAARTLVGGEPQA